MNNNLVLDVLKHADERLWIGHGLGFMKLALPNYARIHIWDDRLLKEGASPVHNHPWGFTSHVISGVLINRTYRTRREPPFTTHKKGQLVCGSGWTCKEIEEVMLLAQDDKIFGGPGSIDIDGGHYAQVASEIHETIATNGTITYLERAMVRYDGKPTDEAQVFWPLGTSFGDAGQNPVSQPLAAQIIKDALDKALSSHAE